MDSENDSPLRSRITELQSALRAAELRLEAEREKLYFLEVDLSALSDLRMRLEHENESFRGLLDSSRFARPGEMCVHPHFGAVHLRAKRNVGFVIMPFGPEWAPRVDDAVALALREKGMRCQRADRRSGREIMKDSWIGMCEAGVVIADVTGRNPNVMYELGLVDAVGQDVILIGQSAQPDDLPFDLLGHRILVYNASDPDALRRSLMEKIEALRLGSGRRTLVGG